MLEEFLELLKQYDKVSVVTHRSADGDTLGTGLGIYGFLKNAGKQNWIVDIDDNTKIAKAIKSFKEGESKIKICKDFIFSKQKVFDSKGSPLIELLMDSQSKLAHFQVGFLLKDNYLRINPKMNSSVALDDVSKMSNLNNVADVNQRQLEQIKKLIGEVE